MADEPLPADAAAAFAQACRRLCTETNPGQRDVMTADSPSPGALLAAGRRVAAAIQFGAQHALADTTHEGPGVPLAHLAGGTELDGAFSTVACSERLLRKLTESALLTPLGPRRWGFAHHSFQEYLAAQYLQHVRRSLGSGAPGHPACRGRGRPDAVASLSARSPLGSVGRRQRPVRGAPRMRFIRKSCFLLTPLPRPGSDRGRLTEALLALAHRR